MNSILSDVLVVESGKNEKMKDLMLLFLVGCFGFPRTFGLGSNKVKTLKMKSVSEYTFGLIKRDKDEELHSIPRDSDH